MASVVVLMLLACGLMVRRRLEIQFPEVVTPHDQRKVGGGVCHLEPEGDTAKADSKAARSLGSLGGF